MRFNSQIAICVLTGMAGDVNTGIILHKHVQVQGIYVGFRDIFEDMNRAMSIDKPPGGYAQQKISPIIDRAFPFTEAIAAMAYLESGAHFGQVVIRI